MLNQRVTCKLQCFVCLQSFWKLLHYSGLFTCMQSESRELSKVRNVAERILGNMTNKIRSCNRSWLWDKARTTAFFRQMSSRCSCVPRKSVSRGYTHRRTAISYFTLAAIITFLDPARSRVLTLCPGALAAVFLHSARSFPSISRRRAPSPSPRPCRRPPERGKWEYFLPEPSWRFASIRALPRDRYFLRILYAPFFEATSCISSRRSFLAFWCEARNAWPRGLSQDHSPESSPWRISTDQRMLTWPDCSRAKNRKYRQKRSCSRLPRRRDRTRTIGIPIVGVRRLGATCTHRATSHFDGYFAATVSCCFTSGDGYAWVILSAGPRSGYAPRTAGSYFFKSSCRHL